MCVITCRMLFSLSCLLWTLSPLKHLFSNFPSFCILSIPPPSVLSPPPSSTFCPLSLVCSGAPRNAYTNLCVRVCVGGVRVVHSGVVWKGVSLRFTSQPSVFSSSSFYPSFTFLCLLTPTLLPRMSLCLSRLSLFLPLLSPEWSSVLQSVENLCFQPSALLPSTHPSVCMLICMNTACVNLYLVSGALNPTGVCFCSVHWCWHESTKPTSSSSSSSIIFFFYFFSFFLTMQKANTISPVHQEFCSSVWQPKLRQADI